MFKFVTSLLWKALFALFMLLTLLILPLQLLTKPFLSKAAYRRLAYFVAAAWGRVTVATTGSRVRVQGRELIPDDLRMCFIGNHQSLFDIPAFVGHIGRPVGFIAKQELFRIPVLSHWMRQLPCTFIDRGSARQAMATFKTSAEIIREGHPLVIFPEGGRSGTDQMREFRRGSLKLAQMADATIVPFAIKGTWRIMEIDGKIHPARVTLRFLPPVPPSHPLYRSNDELMENLRASIQNALDEM